MFETVLNKGFRMTFPNGYTISVQFGPGNYCENRSDALAWSKQLTAGEIPPQKSETAEIAIWDKDDNWMRLQKHEDVVGWITVAQVAQVMNELLHSEPNPGVIRSILGTE